MSALLQAHSAPDPASEKCIPGQHGPACNEDSDCTIYPSCKRCAHSGFCTSLSPGPHPHPGPHGGCDMKDSSYDYLLLVQGWPRSACLPGGRPCHDGNYGKLDYWVMHGLWPSRAGDRVTSYPCVCDDRGFDPSAVTMLNKDMLSYWPSYTGDNRKFWEHEWTKHGTCAGKPNSTLATEFGFFSTTLSLRAQHDIASHLKKASIIPDATQSYSASDVQAALTPIGGQAPLLGCVNKGGQQYLHEVSFCLDKKTLKDVQCDSAIAHLAGDEVSDCDSTKPMILAVPANLQEESVIV